jgi:iron complex transport system ATP-binding protein
MISVGGLSVTRNRKLVLNGIGFQLQPGEFVALTGPNGSGKSTLLQALAGTLPASSGEISIAGKPATTLSRSERAREVAWLAQQRPLAWNLRVEDVAALGRFAQTAAPYDRLGTDERRAVDAALEKTGAMRFVGHDVLGLSGGEQASVHLARLLASDAPVLLLDEPCAALDLSHQFSLMDTLRREAASGRTVLVVLHDLELALRYCPRMIVLCAGGVVGDGPSHEVLADDLLESAFALRRAPSGALVSA